MVVALVALFLSLGGVSYGVATGSITGKAIKNNTVGTKDLKNNDIRGTDVRNGTLTGSDIVESKLGKVPSAASADSASSATNATNATNATTAGNATTVDGFTVNKIDYRASTGTTGTTILSLKGLTITVDCTANQNDNMDVTAPAGSNVSMWGYDGDTTSNDVPDGARDLEDFGGGTLNDVEDTLGDGTANSVGVQFTYQRNNGDVVTGQFNMDETGGIGGAPPCVIGGTAIGG